MLKLTAHMHVLSDVANRLGFSSVYDLLLSGDDSSVASALSQHQELLAEVMRAREEIRRLANSGDEDVANAIMNYLLLRAGGYSIPKTLEAKLAKTVPGIYLVSGEKVLISRPNEDVPPDVSVDTEYMDSIVDKLISVKSSKTISVAGVEYGIVDYDYLYRVFFAKKFAEEAVLRNLVDSCTAKDIPISAPRVHREGDAIVAEAEVDVKALTRNQYGRELPGRMTVSLAAKGWRRVTLVAAYRDDLVQYTYKLDTEYVNAYIKDVVDNVVSNVVHNYNEIRAAREVAEARGYEWVISDGVSYAVKTANIAGADITVKVRYRVGKYGEVWVTVDAPASDAMYNALQNLVKNIGGNIKEEDDRLHYTVGYELTSETALSSIELAESVLTKLQSAFEKTGVPHVLHDESALLGALLLKATNPEVFQDVFERLGTSFLEALKTVFKNVANIDIVRMYKHPREILSAITDSVDVRDDGEPTVFGKTIDELLVPFNVDRRTALNVKRAVVEEFTRVQSASLSAMLMVRGVRLTPELVKKLVNYGDTVPPAVLEQDYQGKPLWHYLSASEKLAVAVKLAKNSKYWGTFSESNVLTPEDGKILAKALCATRSEECTKVAFSELWDELAIPRHAVPKSVSGELYIDTGAYLVKVHHYDVSSGLYTFSIRPKTANKQIDVKSRNMRDALLKIMEEEELQTA